MSCRPVDRWLFGKLPSLGDFVSRGLDFAFRDALDLWLSQQIGEARAALGEQFDDRYFAAPAWCFVDCDPQGQWSGGSLCASVDAAGRKFPLMAGVPANDAGEAAQLAGGCLEMLYAALAEGWDADRLQAAELTGVDLGWQPDQACWAMVGEDGSAIEAPGRFPAGVVQRMLDMAA